MLHGIIHTVTTRTLLQIWGKVQEMLQMIRYCNLQWMYSIDKEGDGRTISSKEFFIVTEKKDLNF